MVIREAHAGELEAAGHVTQAAWREFERPGDPAWVAYFERLGEAPRGRAEMPPEETKPDAPAGEEAERWRRAFGDGGDDPLLRDPF